MCCAYARDTRFGARYIFFRFFSLSFFAHRSNSNADIKMWFQSKRDIFPILCSYFISYLPPHSRVFADYFSALPLSVHHRMKPRHGRKICYFIVSNRQNVWANCQRQVTARRSRVQSMKIKYTIRFTLHLPLSCDNFYFISFFFGGIFISAHLLRTHALTMYLYRAVYVSAVAYARRTQTADTKINMYVILFAATAHDDGENEILKGDMWIVGLTV